MGVHHFTLLGLAHSNWRRTFRIDHVGGRLAARLCRRRNKLNDVAFKDLCRDECVFLSVLDSTLRG